MVLILLILNIAYFVFALSLAAQSHQTVLVLSLMFVGYVLLFAFIWPKPEYSIYAFLLVTLFIPWSGEEFFILKIKEFSTVSLNFLVQSIAATNICLKLLSHRPGRYANPGKFNIFFFLLIASILILTTLNGLLYSQEKVYGVGFAIQDFINYGPLLFGLIFLLGCLNFIDDLKKLEVIFGIFLAFGIIMVLEVVACMVLRLPVPFPDRFINYAGRFSDFFLSDFTKVGVMAFTAMGTILYFGFSRNRYLLLCAVPLLFLPIVFTYERSPLAAGALVVGGFFLLLIWIRTSISKFLLISGSILLVIGVVLLRGDFQAENRVVNLLKGEVRPDYFESYMYSWESRAGAYLRALDVMLYTPFGVGYGKAEDFMGSPEISSHFGPSQDWLAADQTYANILTGLRPTSSHNFFLDFGVEFGVLALGAILWLSFRCLVNFRNFIRIIKLRYIQDRRLILLQSANFAIFLGLVFSGFFQNARLYPVFFFFAFVTFLGGVYHPRKISKVARDEMIRNG